MIADLHHRLDHLGVEEGPAIRSHSETKETPHYEVEDMKICVELPPRETGLNAIPESPLNAVGQMTTSPFSDSAIGISEMDKQQEGKRSVARNVSIQLPAQSSEENNNNDDDDNDGSEKSTEPLLNASRIADQNMKLAIFCTRPTTYAPLINLLTEAISTFFLVIGILFIKERSEFLYEGYEEAYKHGIMSFYIGMLISLLVLCLGGMGVAMNPARDLAPRFAHWILQIDGKGVSEWYYAWIPILGPFVGSAVAALVFMGMRELNKAAGEGGQYDEELDRLAALLNSN